MEISEIEGYIRREVDSFINDQTGDIPVSCDIEENRSGEGSLYFSELEITLWYDDNVADVISIPIYSKGILRDEKENLVDWFKEEYIKSLKKIN